MNTRRNSKIRLTIDHAYSLIARAEEQIEKLDDCPVPDNSGRVNIETMMTLTQDLKDRLSALSDAFLPS
ncbi:MAG TPA: hypothetical protein VNQ76_15270 [Planctomicrobium sp.]|nr:hypothetical protein [Planctomicrobium sp.]